MKYQQKKEKAINSFIKLLEESRNLIREISKGRTIELAKNGVTFVMIDPFDDDGFMSDVEKVEDGTIFLVSGSEVGVDDIMNLTDLIGLLETIDE